MGRLEAMRVFAAVVDGRGFSAASRSLGIPLPTVSRQIAELEKQLGTQLLTRSTRKVVVTDSGRRYYEFVRRILESVADAEAEAAGEYRSPRGQLCIAAPALFGKLHVLPIVRDFMASHSEITARLLFSNFVVDLMEEHIDLAVRIGGLTDESLIAAKVGEVRSVCCASPGYLALRGAPHRPEDLVNHDCVTVSKTSDPIPWLFRSPGQAQQSVAVAPRICVNTNDAAVEAAIAGGGVTWLYSYQAAPHLAVGSLVGVLTEFEANPVSVNIVYPAGRLMPQKVRYFIDFATDRLRAGLDEVSSCCDAAFSRSGLLGSAANKEENAVPMRSR
jgi:DNA-binding transcriptional LysR family regulator